MNTHVLDVVRDQIVAALPAIGTGLAILIGFWILGAIARFSLRRLATTEAARGGREDLALLGATVAYWSALAFGIVIGLGTMGVQVEALVASLGLTGFALGFALRDVISNVLAGVLILFYRPFRYGDRIAVAGFEGLVVNIDLRYTTIDDEDKRHLIPNQTMYSNPVTVFAQAAAAKPAEPASSG